MAFAAGHTQVLKKAQRAAEKWVHVGVFVCPRAGSGCGKLLFPAALRINTHTPYQSSSGEKYTQVFVCTGAHLQVCSLTAYKP